MTQGRVWGNEYRITKICIDSYENEVPVGRIYNPYLEQGKCFRSMVQLLLEVDNMLDHMKLPQSFTVARSFSPNPRLDIGPPEHEEQEKKGSLATFAVKILFRQNASWQGAITWMDTGQEETFRSVLELIFLINSALAQKNKQAS